MKTLDLPPLAAAAIRYCACRTWFETLRHYLLPCQRYELRRLLRKAWRLLQRCLKLPGIGPTRWRLHSVLAELHGELEHCTALVWGEL